MKPPARASQPFPSQSSSVLRDDRSLASIDSARPRGLFSWFTRLRSRRTACSVCGRSVARCAYDGRHPEIGR